MKSDPGASAHAIEQALRALRPDLTEYEAYVAMQVLTGELIDPILRRIAAADNDVATIDAVNSAVEATVLELAGRYTPNVDESPDLQVEP